MSQVVRFGVSIDARLLKQFDTYIDEKEYANRSEAIRDLIRDALVDEEWLQEREIAGGISIVYDHHQGSLVQRLIELQHEFGEIVLASQHVHLDHDNCLEIIVVKGITESVQALFHKLRATKGIKHISIIKSTVGDSIA